ncbi:hypothetical protein TNCV_4956991 [Trichonephila clavipes]|nr:hypothetical protein TNCV_4956991 [Trichonephila clavipes]
MFKTIAYPVDCEVSSIIRFLNVTNVKTAEINPQLVEIYGENVMSDELVRKNRFDNSMMGAPMFMTKNGMGGVLLLMRLSVDLELGWALSQSQSTGRPPRYFEVNAFTKT